MLDSSSSKRPDQTCRHQSAPLLRERNARQHRPPREHDCDEAGNERQIHPVLHHVVHERQEARAGSEEEEERSRNLFSSSEN